MKTRIHLVLGSLAGAAAIHLALLACGMPRRDDDSGALDALADIASAETGEASAQDTGGGSVTMEAPCVVAGVFSYATFSVASVRASDVPRITAVSCRWPAGTNDGSGLDPASMCVSAVWRYVDGRVAVSCGGAAGGSVARIRVD